MLKPFTTFIAESWQASRQASPKFQRSKAEEMEIAKSSPIYKDLNYKGWKVKPTIHAAAQAYDRRPDLEYSKWELMHKRMVDDIESKGRNSGEYLYQSKSLRQAYVVAVDDRAKRINIITVLPKDRNNPKPGTVKVLVESKLLELEVIIID